MPQIKTSLKQLFALFVQSAEDVNLDLPSRQLAARTTVLIAHMQRIEAKIDAVVSVGIKLEKKVDDGIAEIAAQFSQLTGGAPPATTTAGEGDGPSGEETAEEMAERIHRETEEEVARVRASNTPGNGSPGGVTPIRSTEAAPVPPTPENAS
jgi:hypothetical protein